MSDFAWGVLTPFLALGGLVLAVGVAWLLISVARHIWGLAHYSLMDKVTLQPNRVTPYGGKFAPKGEGEGSKPLYLDQANLFRDALLASPKVYTLAGLGWRVMLARDTRSEPIEDDRYVRTADILGDDS